MNIHSNWYTWHNNNTENQLNYTETIFVQVILIYNVTWTFFMGHILGWWKARWDFLQTRLHACIISLLPCVYCASFHYGGNILSLRFNFCRRLCSACLIWVLNKLPRPCSHFCLHLLLSLLSLSPSLTSSPFSSPFLVFLEGSIVLQVKYISLGNKKETLISVRGWVTLFTFTTTAGYVLLLSHRATVAFASSQDCRLGVCRSAASLSKFHEFFSRGPWYL